MSPSSPALTPQALLNGPRGRRFCLELAGRIAAEVAALLDAVPPYAPTEDALLHAMVETVDAARYRQEPDGDDDLAATPEMRLALLRVAQAVVDSPHTQWWSAPMAMDKQWTVQFLDEFTAARDRPADPSANWGGNWWSRPSGLAGSTGAMPGWGPVGLWLVEDRLGEREAVAEQLELPANAHLYEIDSPADWVRLKDKYDGVHLTMGGYLSTAGLAIPLDGGYATVLAGWEPDTTYWLRDVDPVPGTRREWAQGRNSQFWERAMPGGGT